MQGATRYCGASVFKEFSGLETEPCQLGAQTKVSGEAECPMIAVIAFQTVGIEK
jgi:hypothetical protein